MKPCPKGADAREKDGAKTDNIVGPYATTVLSALTAIVRWLCSGSYASNGPPVDTLSRVWRFQWAA